MFIVDAHLDLSMNALSGRDILQPAAQQPKSANLIATVGLFDATGIFLDGRQEKLDLDYAAGKVPDAFDVKSEFNVHPGAYLVRVVLRDRDGHLSSTSQTVKVR